MALRNSLSNCDRPLFVYTLPRLQGIVEQTGGRVMDSIPSLDFLTCPDQARPIRRSSSAQSVPYNTMRAVQCCIATTLKELLRSMDAKEYIPLSFAAYKPCSRKMVITYALRDSPETPPVQPELTTGDDGVVLSSENDAEVLGESHPCL